MLNIYLYKYLLKNKMMISIKSLTLIALVTLVTIQSVNGQYKPVKKSQKSIAYIPLNIDDDG